MIYATSALIGNYSEEWKILPALSRTCCKPITLVAICCSFNAWTRQGCAGGTVSGRIEQVVGTSIGLDFSAGVRFVREFHRTRTAARMNCVSARCQ